MRMGFWVETWWQDVRLAARHMARRPGFPLAACLTLALGIGANGAIFNLANALLLRPIPAERPEELVRVFSTQQSKPRVRVFSYPDYVDLRDHNRSLGGLVAINSATVAWNRGGESQQLLGDVVSANYFSVLGVRMALGRAFLDEEDQPGAARVVVLSHDLWASRLDADPAVVGKSLALNGGSFSVIGVAPPRFQGSLAGLQVDLWVPLRQAESWIGKDWTSDRTMTRVTLLGRRLPGVGLEEAEADLSVIAARLARAYPETNRGKGVELEPARYFDTGLRGPVTVFLGVVMALVGVVLLTACINLAGLLLVRASARRREMAVRLALGASRARLVSQVLTESGLLALLGGGLGLFFALWTSQLLTGFNPLPASIPIRLDLQPDVRLYGFTLALALLCGLLLGLAPAVLSSRTQVIAGLKEQAASLAGRSRLRGLFVAAQVALSLLLAVSAALFVRSLGNARGIDVGFAAGNALALDLDVKSKAWSEGRARQYFREALERVRAVPGVRSAAFANLAPLDLATPRVDVRIAGFEPSPGQEGLPLSFNRVSPRYFETLRIPLRSGRDFSEDDDAGRPAVAIVNETMARRFWRGQDPLGRSFRVLRGRGLVVEQMAGGAEVQVVGVARDVKYRSLGEEPEPHLYLAYLQHFDTSRTLIVASAGDSAPMIATVQRELQALEPDLPGFFSRTLVQHMGLSLVPARMAAALSTLFGTLALLLASVGLYGVVAHSVAERTREIGIRIALGARASDVSRLVLVGGTRLLAAGLAAGLVLALVLTRFLRALLYGVSATDPAVFLGVSLLLALVALVASWIPARRALRVDPLLALRHE